MISIGCDLHPFLEVRRAETLDWEYVDVPIYHGRNYYLFAYLSDVRNDGGVEPFGFPMEGEDRKQFLKDFKASKEVCEVIEQWGLDFHSITILSGSALREAFIRCPDQTMERGWAAAYLKSWSDICESLKKAGFADARLVVAYDN